LEQQLLHRITPTLSELTIFPIRNEKNEVVFLIDMPISHFAPHMAHDHQYQKRVNFGSQVMEHYEVQNLFRINWTMKEKLVEKIYEPLSTILRKHIKHLEKKIGVQETEIDEPLTNNYYFVPQLPRRLFHHIVDYLSLAKDVKRALVLTRSIDLEISSISRNALIL
jgi:hypothetical protein